MRWFKGAVAAACVAAAGVVQASGQVVYVDVANNSGVENGSVTNPYNTIQEGVNVASNGTTVSVAAGTYAESVIYVDFKRGVTIQGAGTNTVLTYSNLKMLVRFSDSVTVRDLTFRGGYQGRQVSQATNIVVKGNLFDNMQQYAYNAVGAFAAYSSSLLLEGNVFKNNYGGQYAGAGYISYCSATILSNDFINNYAWNNSGALKIYIGASGSVFRLAHNYFDNNRADYSAIDISGSTLPNASVDHNVFLNTGPSYSSVAGAVRVSLTGTDVFNVVNNVFKDPYAACCGGSRVGMSVQSSSTVYVANNIFSSSAGIWSVFSYDATNPNLRVEYNDSFGMSYYQVTSGVGGISSNPLFVNPAARDYHLQAGSPAINAGNPASQYNDADGSRNDMGIYGGLQSAPNLPPVANAQSVGTAEDTPVAITLTGSDPESSPLSFIIASSPSKGALSGTAPNVTYTPSANTNGIDSFTFRVSDGASTSAAATVTINVTPVNDAPVADIIVMPVYEDTTTPFTLSGSDVDGDTLTFIVTQLPVSGVVSGTPPNLTYTPVLNFTGNDEIRFKVNDGQLDSNTGLVSFTVNGVNDAPVAQNQNVTTAEDTSKQITLTATDIDSTNVSFSVLTQPAHGSLSGANATWNYTPALNYNGADSFTFNANDNALTSGAATVSITVTPVQDTPTAPGSSWTTMQDTAVGIFIGATDPDGDTLNCSVQDPPHGTIAGTFPNYTYTPDAGFVGQDYFSYTVTDPATNYNYSLIFVTVKPNTTGSTIFVDAANTSGVENGTVSSPYNTIQEGVNVSVPGSVIAVAAGTYNEVVNLSGRSNVTVNGAGNLSSLTYAGQRIIVTNAQNITIRNLRLTGGIEGLYAKNATALLLKGDIFENFNSSGPISPLVVEYSTVRVEGCLMQSSGGRYGGNGGSFFNCDVTFVTNLVYGHSSWSGGSVVSFYNDASNASRRIKICRNIFASASSMEAFSLGGYGAADVDHNTLYDIGSRYQGMMWLFPRGGAAVRVINNVFRNEPDTTFDQSKKHIFIDLTSTGAIQILNNIFSDTSGAAVYNRSAVSPTFEYNDMFNMTNLSVTAGPGNINADPLFATVYNDFHLQAGSPAINAGNPAAVYNDADGTRNDMGIYGGNTNNAAPTALSQSVSTSEDTPKAITLAGTDPNGNPLTFSIVANPAKGALSGQGSSVIYTPNANTNGTDTFTFRVFDGALYSAAATVTVTVSAVSDAPVAQNQSVTNAEDTAKAITLVATDPDGGSLTYTVVTGPGNGTLTGTAPNLTYRPATNYFGADSFIFRASDGSLTSNVATVSITVTSVNDAPVSQGQSVIATQNVAKAITLVASDIDSGSLTYTILLNPSNGVLSGTMPNITYTSSGSFVGTNKFTFKVNDGQVDSNISTVTVAVVAGPAGPVTTIYVNVANSGVENGTLANPWNTIQEGVNAAGTNGITINVAAGTYNEYVSIYLKRNLSLVGAGLGTIVTNASYRFVIQNSDNIGLNGFNMRGGVYPGVYVSQSSNVTLRSSTIEGVMRNGYQYGGALEAWDASVNIVSNRIVNNYGGQRGGIGYFVRSSLQFIANTATNNMAWNSAGGLYLYGTTTGITARISRNFFDLNLADYSGAIDVLGYYNPLTIDNNSIANSGSDYVQGGSIVVSPWRTNDPITIINNVIKDPYFPCCYGARVGIMISSSGDVYVANNILTSPNGYGVYSYYPNSGARAEYNDAYGVSYYQVTAGLGSIIANPLFVNQATNNFTLQAGSPCINTGNPAAQYNDLNGSRNDMGRFGGPNGY